MPEAPTPTALQMTDGELAIEQARGRMVGMISILTVAMYSAYLVINFFVGKSAVDSGDAARLASVYEHKFAVIISGLFFAVASILLAALLSHIILAARDRSNAVPKVALYVSFAGPALVALIYPILTIIQINVASKFADASVHTDAAATKLIQGSAIDSLAPLVFFAQLVLAIAWVMVAVYGMRVGLLTRLIGFVAVAIGGINLLSAPSAALLEVFWVGAVAILLVGESPSTPPAWKLGRIVTWREVAAMGAALDEDPKSFEKPGE